MGRSRSRLASARTNVSAVTGFTGLRHRAVGANRQVKWASRVVRRVVRLERRGLRCPARTSRASPERAPARCSSALRCWAIIWLSWECIAVAPEGWVHDASKLGVSRRAAIGQLPDLVPQLGVPAA
jgi:hypothetical protein